MNPRTRTRASMLMLATATATTAGAQQPPALISLADLRAGQSAHGFRADARYMDAAGRPLGARWVHERTGFTFDYLSIQPAPQAFIWTRALSDLRHGPAPHPGTPAGRQRDQGRRALGDLEIMPLGVSSALVQGWRAACHFNTAAGPETSYTLLDAYLDALLHPDYTDEEIRREVRNFGATIDPDGTLWLEEKGTVYNEMVTTFERPTSLPYRALQQAWYGTHHPPSWYAGGLPAAIREMTPEDIRRFHASHYRLGNMGMIAALPPPRWRSATSWPAPPRSSTACKATAPVGGNFLTEDRLPAPASAPAGQIRFIEYPHQTPRQPRTLFLGWPPERRPGLRDQLLLELFLANFAGDATTNLYRILIDGQTRKIQTGAQSVSAFVSRDLGPTRSPSRSPMPRPHSSPKPRVREVRERILAELRALAAYPDRSPELAEFSGHAARSGGMDHPARALHARAPHTRPNGAWMPGSPNAPGNSRRPLYIGLVNPNTQGGVFPHGERPMPSPAFTKPARSFRNSRPPPPAGGLRPHRPSPAPGPPPAVPRRPRTAAARADGTLAPPRPSPPAAGFGAPFP